MAHLKDDEYWAVVGPELHIFKWSLGYTKVVAITLFFQGMGQTHGTHEAMMGDWRTEQKRGRSLAVVRLSHVAQTVKEARAETQWFMFKK